MYNSVPGADPGFWERGCVINIFTTGGGYGRGRAPFHDRNRVWGSAGRFFAFAFIEHEIHSDIQYIYTSRDIWITRACMNSDEKTVHSSQCYSSYWLMQQLNS